MVARGRVCLILGVFFCIVAGMSDGVDSYVMGFSALGMVAYGTYLILRADRVGPRA